MQRVRQPNLGRMDIRGSDGPTATSLHDLPDEILTDIVEWAGTLYYVSEAGRVCTSLPQLALCSRRLHRITTSFLYKSVVLRTNSHLLNFARLVLRTPHLATRVESLVLHETNDGGKATRHRLKLSNWTESDFGRCQDIIETITDSPSELSYWLDEILQGSWDSLASLVLLSLPNLSTLSMPENGLASCSQRFHWVLKEIAAKQTTRDNAVLPILNEIRLDCYLPEQQAVARRMNLFVRIPSVQKLRIDYLHSCWWGHDSSFDVAELTLNYCYLRGDLLASFIQFFHNLRILRIMDSDSAILTDLDRGSILKHLKPTLEELILHNRAPSGRRSSRFSPASLAGFQTLRTISIDVPSLLGYGLDNDGVGFEGEEDVGPALSNLLPPSLETLALKRCDWRIIRHLDARSLLDGSKLSSLHSVTIYVQYAIQREEEGGEWVEVDLSKVWPISAVNQTQKLLEGYDAKGVSLSFEFDPM
jgi:hypothetical protein